ncbi:TPA: ACT domain-containing protein [archaeon]|uniref:ACT domain-containing protein n=1 Tax=Candidatus Naiadarchaeum limnaeum TaxID=2756139 RepID=A0A832UN98_9ARCH|nr:ACT domain-containing protein [Candidatus Naiadarchaeum limnaeum]
MQEIQVLVKDKPGELARVTEILGDHGINIRGISSDTRKRGDSFLRIVVNKEDQEKATSLLSISGGYKVKTNTLLFLSLINRPGELAKVAKLLAKQGINVESIYLRGSKKGLSGRPETEVVMNVSDLSGAQKLLKSFVVKK